MLDDYTTNLVSAYSTRRLLASFGGSAIRVREDSGNTEADIGFDADGNLDTTALLAHTGSNSGYVVTWYDQSGNGNDATNATAARQPRIVGSGTVDAYNTIPSLYRPDASEIRYLGVTHSPNISQPFTRFARLKLDPSEPGEYGFMFDGDSNRVILGGTASVSYKWRIYVSGTSVIGPLVSADHNTATAVYNNNSSVLRINGEDYSNSNAIGTGALQTDVICGSSDASAGNPQNSYLWEYLLYGADMTSSFSEIESIIGGY